MGLLLTRALQRLHGPVEWLLLSSTSRLCPAPAGLCCSGTGLAPPLRRQCPGIVGMGTWPELGSADTKPELSAQTPKAALALTGAQLLLVLVGAILIPLGLQS